MSAFKAKPMSRNKIRELANYVRDVFGLSNEKFFPVVPFLEIGLPQLDKEFNLEIRPVEEMGSKYGVTYPEKHIIELREDVYENAIKGVARDRFTVAHEIGHYLMHSPERLEKVELTRLHGREEVPVYMRPEWQANTFAGELLVPRRVIQGLSIDEIMTQCGVSREAAAIQLKYK